MVSDKIAFGNFNFIVAYHRLRTRRPRSNGTKQRDGEGQ